MEQQESAALARVLALLGQPFQNPRPLTPTQLWLPLDLLSGLPSGAGLGSLIHFPWACMLLCETGLGVPGTQVTLASPGVLD